MNNHLTAGEWIHAVHMWANGCDTLKIAEYFNIPEPVVYRKLPFYREKYRTIQEKAA
jgi:hypothetical protein